MPERYQERVLQMPGLAFAIFTHSASTRPPTLWMRSTRPTISLEAVGEAVGTMGLSFLDPDGQGDQGPQSQTSRRATPS